MRRPAACSCTKPFPAKGPIVLDPLLPAAAGSPTMRSPGSYRPSGAGCATWPSCTWTPMPWRARCQPPGPPSPPSSTCECARGAACTRELAWTSVCAAPALQLCSVLLRAPLCMPAPPHASSTCRSAASNRLSGPLPLAWGTMGGGRVYLINLSANKLTGNIQGFQILPW